jgi:hypothetical protein
MLERRILDLLLFHRTVKGIVKPGMTVPTYDDAGMSGCERIDVDLSVLRERWIRRSRYDRQPGGRQFADHSLCQPFAPSQLFGAYPFQHSSHLIDQRFQGMVRAVA